MLGWTLGRRGPTQQRAQRRFLPSWRGLLPWLHAGDMAMPCRSRCCRYFTVPFMLVVLHAPQPPRWAALATAAAFVIVDAATWYLFLARPFTWVDGSTARFMW